MSRGMITMNPKELQRLAVLEAVFKKQTTQGEAAACLDLSTRQVRRLQRRLERHGASGLAHGNRGRPSNHRFPERTRQRVLELIRQRYADFGPTLACEKLDQVQGIRLSDETLRRWMRAEGLQAGRRRPRPHRQWRERSACLGAMVQMDGSHHDWLEGRGSRLVLMGYVDDATGKAYGRFYESEDLSAALDSFRRYCRLYGIPQSVYVDRHTIYKSTGKPTLEDHLNNRQPQSQFERALSELGVRVIHAYSPQAKGRVERLFKTFQDRLVKEMRLSRIRTRTEANRFLQGFLRGYNRHFSKPARQEGNLHRPIPRGTLLTRVLCVKEPRVVANDGTIQVGRQRWQLFPPGLRPMARKSVTLTIPPHGRWEVLHEGRSVRYRVLPVSTKPPSKPTEPELTPARLGRPAAATHPWKRAWSPRQIQKLRARGKSFDPNPTAESLKAFKP